MKKLLYISIREIQGFWFGVPLAHRDGYDLVFDLDNFSDAQTLNYALRFMEQSGLKVVIHAEPKAEIGKLMYLLNQIKETKPELEIIGNHRMLRYLAS